MVGAGALGRFRSVQIRKPVHIGHHALGQADLHYGEQAKRVVGAPGTALKQGAECRRRLGSPRRRKWLTAAWTGKCQRGIDTRVGLKGAHEQAKRHTVQPRLIARSYQDHDCSLSIGSITCGRSCIEHCGGQAAQRTLSWPPIWHLRQIKVGGPPGVAPHENHLGCTAISERRGNPEGHRDTVNQDQGLGPAHSTTRAAAQNRPDDERRHHRVASLGARQTTPP